MEALAQHTRPRRTEIIEFGSPLEGYETHVVMCTWQRINLFPNTLQMLADQTESVQLHVWNNNWGQRDEVERLASEAAIPIRITHSLHNIGGFGRFYTARDLLNGASFSDEIPIIFVDDDQVLAKDAIATLLAEFSFDSLAGVWAFRFQSTEKYWLRTRVDGGERADYLGTGGLVAPLGIFGDDRVFDCPRRFWFIEDLWLSYFALSKGMTLRGIDAGISFHPDDGLNQYQRLTVQKTRFYRYLRRRGAWPNLD